jgi:molybdopterin biosynthesis enzyme
MLWLTCLERVQGQLCLKAGTLLGPAEIGILATVGATKVRVHSKPVVTVMSTGDEVVDADTLQLGPGQIRDSNRSMLVAAVQATGCQAQDAGIISDDVRVQWRTLKLRANYPQTATLLRRSACTRHSVLIYGRHDEAPATSFGSCAS